MPDLSSPTRGQILSLNHWTSQGSPRTGDLLKEAKRVFSLFIQSNQGKAM